jgi:predicted dehydrogenase
MDTNRGRVPVGLAVAGLGRIGRLHVDNIARHVGCAQLALVVDAVEAKARELGMRHSVPWSTSFAETLHNLVVEGVVLATPTALHAELTEAAARAGKHVFCEKPFGFDPVAARRAAAAARDARVHLVVGFQRRFDREWIAIADMVRSGRLGEIHVMRISHRDAYEPRAVDALGNLFVDVAIHDFDSVRWLAGEVESIYATTSPSGSEAVSILQLSTGGLAVVDNSRRARYGFECSAEIMGSKATVRTGQHHRRRDIEYLRAGVVEVELPQHHAERHAAAYVAELDRFAAAVRGEAPEGATGDDALAAIAIARAAGRSVASDARVVVDDTLGATVAEAAHGHG